MRIYIPATLAMLQRFVADGSLLPVSGTAFAVTPKLREAYAEGDDDELGEVALREAALASLRLLAGATDGRDGCRPTATRCRRDGRYWLPMSAMPPCDPISTMRWCGSPRRWPRKTWSPRSSTTRRRKHAVQAAVEVIDAADLGDEDAELTVGDAQDHDLAWYATQELPFLLELL